MHKIFFIFFFIFSAFLSIAQNNLNPLKAPGIYLPDGTKLDEHKKTFEIKGNPNPDKSTLSKIDVSRYWKLMDLKNRVEVVDDVTGLTLILYSHNETKALLDFTNLLVVMPNELGTDESRKSP